MSTEGEVDTPSRVFLPVGSCDAFLAGVSTPPCVPCQGGEQAGVPDGYRVTKSHTPVGHTHMVGWRPRPYRMLLVAACLDSRQPMHFQGESLHGPNWFTEKMRGSFSLQVCFRKYLYIIILSCIYIYYLIIYLYISYIVLAYVIPYLDAETILVSSIAACQLEPRSLKKQCDQKLTFQLIVQCFGHGEMMFVLGTN